MKMKLKVKILAVAIALMGLTTGGSATCKAAGGYDEAEMFSAEPAPCQNPEDRFLTRAALREGSISAVNWAAGDGRGGVLPYQDGSISQSSGGTAANVSDTNSVAWYVQLIDGVGATLQAGVTNLAIEPFGIYSLNAPAGQARVGGGLGVFYNLNNYVAPGAGLVYLGHLSAFSGSVTLRAPFQPLPTTLPDLWVVPNALVGLETAVGGADGDNGTAGSLAGGGVSVSYGHLWGGQFNSGIEFVNRTAAGGYSGWAVQPFVGWSKAF